MTYYIIMAVIMISAVILLAYNYKLSRDIKKIRGSVTIYQKISCLVKEYEIDTRKCRDELPVFNQRISKLRNMVDDENYFHYEKLRMVHSSFIKFMLREGTIERLEQIEKERKLLLSLGLPDYTDKMAEITISMERIYFPIRGFIFHCMNYVEMIALLVFAKIVTKFGKHSKYKPFDKDDLDGPDKVYYNGDSLEMF